MRPVCLLIAILFGAQFACSQTHQTFVIKKATAKSIAGYYCTDYTTDGRLCFYFDTLGGAHTLVSTNGVGDIAIQFLNAKANTAIGNYTISGDTLQLITTAGISGTGFQKNYTGKMTTTITGVVNGSEIEMTITAFIEGMPPSVKTIKAYRVKQ